jgi:hypothetical protein
MHILISVPKTIDLYLEAKGLYCYLVRGEKREERR